MKYITKIKRCSKCGREYPETHGRTAPKTCKTRGCSGDVVEMTVVRKC